MEFTSFFYHENFKSSSKYIKKMDSIIQKSFKTFSNSARASRMLLGVILNRVSLR